VIRTVLIADDEKTIIKRKRWMAERQCYILKGAYLNMVEAIREVDWSNIDAVHIENSYIHWTVVSEMLLKLNPFMELVFFSESSNTNAFVIKNVSIHELSYGTESLLKAGSKRIEQEVGISIRCFGGLTLCCGDDIIFLPTQKSEEIIAFLANNGTKPVMRDVIIEALWPDTDAEKGINNFHVSVHNIRKVLKEKDLPNLLLQNKGYYYLDPKHVYCDVWEFSDLVWKLKRVHYSDLEMLERASEIFRGPYFGTNAYPWSSDNQYRLECEFEVIQNNLYDFYMKEQAYVKAAQAMEALININSLSADAYDKRVKALIAAGKENTALACLMELEVIYNRELSEPLPMNLQNIKKSLITAKYRSKALSYEALSS